MRQVKMDNDGDLRDVSTNKNIPCVMKPGVFCWHGCSWYHTVKEKQTNRMIAYCKQPAYCIGEIVK